MNCVTIKRIWSDDNMIELEFYANSSNIASQISFYTTKEEIINLSNSLLKFPDCKNKCVEWIVGSIDHKSYVYFKFKTFLVNKLGHIALEIEMNNNLSSPYTVLSHFFIPTYIADINQFGSLIIKLLECDDTMIEAITFRT